MKENFKKRKNFTNLIKTLRYSTNSQIRISTALHLQIHFATESHFRFNKNSSLKSFSQFMAI